jgi:hypothetical protein
VLAIKESTYLLNGTKFTILSGLGIEVLDIKKMFK